MNWINKFYFYCLIILYVAVSVSYGYAYITDISIHPDFPDKCYEPELKVAYAQGFKFKPPDKCEVTTCTSDFRFSVLGCPLAAPNPDECHRIEQDLSLPYPDCCKLYECKNGDKI